MEIEQFEDVLPIEDGDFPASHVSLPKCIGIGLGAPQSVLSTDNFLGQKLLGKYPPWNLDSPYK